MKRRWTVLFYCALACLVGVSWLSRNLGISLFSFMGVSLFGMVLATVTAFLAMIRNVHDKWPAAIVLVCAGPMLLDMVRLIGELTTIFQYFGGSFALMTAGVLATGATAIVILMLPAPPPAAPSVAPARVVD